MPRYSLAFEFEAPDNYSEDGLRVLQVEAEVSVSAYDPGVCSGPVDRCYPPEGGEVEIDAVKIDGKAWPEKDWPQGLADEIQRRAIEADEKAEQSRARFCDW